MNIFILFLYIEYILNMFYTFVVLYSFSTLYLHVLHDHKYVYIFHILCLFIYSVFIYIYSSVFDHVGEFEHVLCVRSFAI